MDAVILKRGPEPSTKDTPALIVRSYMSCPLHALAQESRMHERSKRES